MLSRLVITFLPRSKHLLISWLQSPSAVILEPQKIKSDTVSTVSPSIYCHNFYCHTLTFFNWNSLIQRFLGLFYLRHQDIKLWGGRWQSWPREGYVRVTQCKVFTMVAQRGQRGSISWAQIRCVWCRKGHQKQDSEHGIPLASSKTKDWHISVTKQTLLTGLNAK